MTKSQASGEEMMSSKQRPFTISTPSVLYSAKLCLYLVITFVVLFIFVHIQLTLQTPSCDHIAWPSSMFGRNRHPRNNHVATDPLVESMASKLRESVTFLPLKDLRYANTAQNGHTWFMSSMYDSHEEGDVQYQHFPRTSSDPSSSSNGTRILCMKGHDEHDGAWNSYALAYPGFLPDNATLLKGLTFVSYNHYNYDNIWHGLSAMVPFVAWHTKAGKCAVPARWFLYHWGEIRTKMSPWLRDLMAATFGGPVTVETTVDQAVCFEEAVVMRHNEGGMSRDRRMEVYDLMRCKARSHCNLTMGEGRGNDKGRIGMTLLMRTGPRSFRNESAVVGIFERECNKVEGCHLRVAHSNNLTFCQQVKLMSETDILVSPHGAQLTNMFLMDRNSSVLEFFPKGWLKIAGVGQYVYHWIASWSGMRHEGAWRDPDGDHCPYSDDDRRCMPIYKSGKIGYNESYFGEWGRNVLNEVKIRKAQQASNQQQTPSTNCMCT